MSFIHTFHSQLKWIACHIPTQELWNRISYRACLNNKDINTHTRKTWPFFWRSRVKMLQSQKANERLTYNLYILASVAQSIYCERTFQLNAESNNKKPFPATSDNTIRLAVCGYDSFETSDLVVGVHCIKGTSPSKWLINGVVIDRFNLRELAVSIGSLRHVHCAKIWCRTNRVDLFIFCIFS